MADRSLVDGSAIVAVVVVVAGVLLSATVLAAAVGVVLAPILEDLIDGLFILVNRPYDIGDPRPHLGSVRWFDRASPVSIPISEGDDLRSHQQRVLVEGTRSG